jgi:hypothetical protein
MATVEWAKAPPALRAAAWYGPLQRWGKISLKNPVDKTLLPGILQENEFPFYPKILALSLRLWELRLVSSDHQKMPI